MTPGVPPPAAGLIPAVRRRRKEPVLPLLIVAIALIAGFIEPRFWSVDNLVNLARQMVPLLIISVGQAFALISGGLDLALAAVMSLSGVAGTLAMKHSGIAAGISLMMAIGIVAGLLSGAIIAYFRTTTLVVILGQLTFAHADGASP